ncbi:MAG: response regulator [Bacteroidetes bacterium]|jgi:CheY-like chemotaxis protein/signal transduction histidine kinase/HAMP domain-containing protein|nr:response regulator [Bacteroidota bacterium]MBT6686520.1 response regulator [Bacteroidota bacterium]MBT7143415.1 response regulator [Bacteroidota bacterium]MBT7493525.1 response regulator [Bacteroidota bacterium]
MPHESRHSNKKYLKISFINGLGKLILSLLLGFSVIPIAILSYIIYLDGKSGMEKVIDNNLKVISALKAENLDLYFAKVLSDVETKAGRKDYINFFMTLNDDFGKKKAEFYNFNEHEIANSKYLNIDNEFKDFVKHNYYQDVIFLDLDGNILYSSNQKKAIGTSILSGDFSSPELEKSFSQALIKNKPVLSDITFYGRNRNLAIFMLQPIFYNQKKVGLTALQIPVSNINNLMLDTTGLGKTGSTYIIGKDLLLRSASRNEPETSILNKKMDTELSVSWKNGTARKDFFYVDKYGEIVGGAWYISKNLTDLGVDWAIVAEMQEVEANAMSNGMKVDMIMLTVIIIIIVIILAIWITIKIVKPIIRLSNWAKEVSLGKLSYQDIKLPKNEVGEMKDRFGDVVNTFKAITEVSKSIAIGDYSKSVEVKSKDDQLGKSVNEMRETLISVVNHAQKIAIGDFTKSVEVKSEKDQLGNSLKQMRENLISVVDQANTIAKGDYSKEIEPKSEKDELGVSLSLMTKTLAKVTAENERQNWLKTGQATLGDKMRGDLLIADLCQNIISFIAEYLDVQVGAMYYKSSEDKYKMIASYAYAHRKNLSNEIKIGEGIVGQSILERKMIIVSNLPEDYISVSSGLGKSSPKCVLVLPCIYDGKILGVIEIGSFTELSDLKIDFLQAISENVAISMNSAIARTELQILLEQTQQQAEELQTQQEELRVSNEELEEQTKALRKSEQELQAQQEELRSTNEELEEQTKALKKSEQGLQAQQEELRVTNEELEERTKSIKKQKDDIEKKNTELNIAQKEIEKKANDLEMASKYKSEFLANMSHELRTPLNSILVLSQILGNNRNENLTEKQIKSAKTIYSSGNSLLSLINEVLDLSKVEAGKLELSIEKMYVSEFISEIEETFVPLTKEKGLEFRTIVDEKLPKSILTDSMRVQQIIRNLISNALKFTKKGSISLKLLTPSEKIVFSNKLLNKENSIMISVEDTGIGIPAEKQSLIFEAFKQADGTTSRKYGGTGLGLTISKNFAYLLGGELQLESIEDNGTIFSLIIPLVFNGSEGSSLSENAATSSFVEQKSPTVSVPEKSIVTSDSPKPLKPEVIKENIAPTKSPDNVRDDRTNIKKGDIFILIIEDDVDFSQILYDLAHERNFKCMIARNGETGLHYADYYKPNAIILDIGLPGISGWEVMDRLKENPQTRHIPVHFMSGADKSLEAMKKGAVGFLTKPVSLDDINKAFEKINDIISKPLKKLLVVEDDEAMRMGIVELIEESDVAITPVETGKEALKLLKNDNFDCIILDLGLGDMTGFDLLQKIGKKGKASKIPVIIYTGKDLTREDEKKLQAYSDRIIIKGVKSPDRLLAETTLFLHRVESDLAEDKQKILKGVHSKDDIMKDKKVLIVDDDMRNVFALTSLLEERGLEIVVGMNGKEALARLEEHPDTNLVLMDIMMPEMNGYEAMEEIRKQRKFSKLPMIALTAKAMQGDRDKCISSGANDYLTKPVDTERLLSVLRVWLYQ